jgi:hypothetical protein
VSPKISHQYLTAVQYAYQLQKDPKVWAKTISTIKSYRMRCSTPSFSLLHAHQKYKVWCGKQQLLTALLVGAITLGSFYTYRLQKDPKVWAKTISKFKSYRMPWRNACTQIGCILRIKHSTACVVSIAARCLSVNDWMARCFSTNWSRLRWNVPTAACEAVFKDRPVSRDGFHRCPR